MKLKLLTLIVLSLLLFIKASLAISEGTVTIALNSTKVWWNDAVNASGTATYANGTGVNGTVVFKIDSVQMCSHSVGTDGFWNCTFTAPDEVKAYTVSVNVTNTSGYSFTNSTTLNVAPTYGPNSPIVDKVVYEQPILIQDLNGTIKKIWVRITTWKG